ncbi:hypothetical protein BKA70DRAFT_1573295 [Coprinopsis sp. MPI-PUGE-AT-0042]|nr:hypothetical protein BKA70DRAFT_1573295 [Coprinopsis sp. MPI-PUGE-AT-0042]
MAAAPNWTLVSICSPPALKRGPISNCTIIITILCNAATLPPPSSSATSMQQTQELPAELVNAIFERCSQDMLKDLSITCQRFRDIAHSILFRKIFVCVDALESDTDAYYKARFLEESPHIVQHVKVVHVWIASGFYIESSCAILAQLRHRTIHELDVDVALHVTRSGPFDELVIKMCKSPCLQKLTLGNYPPSRALASLQTSLSHLKLALQPQQAPAQWAQPERGRCASLDSLGFVWDRPFPSPGLEITLRIFSQILHFLDEDRSRVDLRQLRSFHMPIQMGKVIHGVSECRAVLARCQYTLQTLSLVIDFPRDRSINLPPLDSVLVGIEVLSQLRTFEVKAAGRMEHSIRWVHAQLNAASSHCLNLQTVDFFVVTGDVTIHEPHTSVWGRLDALLSDRKGFPHLRAVNVRLDMRTLSWLSVGVRVSTSEIVAKMPRLTEAGMLRVDHM